MSKHGTELPPPEPESVSGARRTFLPHEWEAAVEAYCAAFLRHEIDAEMLKEAFDVLIGNEPKTPCCLASLIWVGAAFYLCNGCGKVYPRTTRVV